MIDIKLKIFIKNELHGWTPFETFWLILSVAVITALSFYWGDSPVAVISSVAGVMYSICAGKGKLCAYFFGVINCVLYALIAFKATFYGETMLNIIYYLPMQFVGFYVWQKNMNPQTHEVKKNHLSSKNRIFLLVAIAVSTVLYGFLLQRLGDKMPFVDSFTTVSSVFAMIITVKMCSEQWWIWFAVNLLSVFMWWKDFSGGSDNIATLLMWIIYLFTSVFMLIKWEKEIYLNSKEQSVHPPSNS